MTKERALEILKEQKSAYERVRTKTKSLGNRQLAEKEIELLEVCIDAIEDKPMVEAIPIVWLEEFREKKKKIYDIDLYCLLGNVIEEWRKENA